MVCSWVAPYLAPVKALAKKFSGFALKTKLSSPLIDLIKSIANIASKILNAIRNFVKKIPFVGKKWAKKINVSAISEKIAGMASSVMFNKILDVIVSNITVFLSVGGFISGILDWISDKRFNNKIVFPFNW